MDEQLTLFGEGSLDVARLKELKARVLAHPDAAATMRGLEGDWRDFVSWCAAAGRRSLPASAETVELYVLACAAERQHTLATIERRLWAIRRKHREASQASPVTDEVRAVLRGLARERGRRPVRRKQALTVAELRAMVGTLDGRTRGGARDQAVLLVGFSTGLRSSELAGLDRRDVAVRRDGYLVRIGRTKADQEGRGRELVVGRGRGRLDGAQALDRWLRWRGDEPGPLFGLSSRWILEVVKRSAAAAGLDASQIGAHSLRAGMMTELDTQGLSLGAIMARSGHRSITVAARYIRRRDAALLDPLARRASG